MNDILESSELFIIICGIVTGSIARIITLKVDTRQNPSYPNGYFINVVIGIVAATLGAVFIPALLTKNFTAVTFLTLAIQHFRDIRKLESDSLEKLENTEYSRRGEAYIDGISKTFEARNYHSLLTALVTVLVLKIFYTENIIFNLGIAAISGLAVISFLAFFTKGKKIGDISTLTIGEITIENSDLYVDGMFVTSFLGTDKARKLFLNEGIGIVVHPNKDKFRVTLENPGQRHAMLFEATRTFGVKRFKFTEQAFIEGKIIIAFVPIIRNPDGIIDVISNTPVLENSRKIHSIMSSMSSNGGSNDERK